MPANVAIEEAEKLDGGRQGYMKSVPEGRDPIFSGSGSLFAATFDPDWQSGGAAPSPQRSSPSCTYL